MGRTRERSARTREDVVSGEKVNAIIAGESELARLIRSHEWGKTPLGPIERWPQSLRTSVNLILNSQHPMWIGWGAEATFLYNDAYIQVLSLAKHPWALGRPAKEVWSEIWDVCGPLADKVFQKGEPTFLDDVRLFMNRGDYVEETYYSFSYSPIRDESGQVAGLFCPSAEVTSKVLNARRLQTLSELSAAAFVEKNVESACNSALRTLAKNQDDIPFALLFMLSSDDGKMRLKACTGISSEVAQRGFGFLQDPALNQQFARLVGEVLRGSDPEVLPLEGMEGLPTGPAEQPVKTAIVLPVHSRAEDRAVGVLIAGVNPTVRLETEYRTFYELVASYVATAIANARAYEDERQRAETLAELDRAKTTFYSNVSHEFRTPLTLMLGPLEEVLAKGPEDVQDDNRHLVDVAHRNGTRLLKLVNTLLDFSRIEAGRSKVNYQPINLAEFTRDLASLFRSATDRAGLKLTIISEALPQLVYVDREMWEKIVLNLLSNAFKFTFEGEILVRLDDKGDRAELTVKDTGVGIPEDELSRVFERFHRVEGAKGRSFEGSGIGLSLVQELVKLHGGTISVESALGKGTGFHVSVPYGAAHLPVERVSEPDDVPGRATVAQPYLSEALSWLQGQPEQAQPSHYAPEPLPEGSTGQLKSVLLADDNRDMREYVSRLLRSQFEVTAVENGKLALEQALREAPDVVLTDIMMPEMDGFELIAALRQNPKTSTLPVVLVSARAGEEARIEGLQRGADDYLVKPFSARELLATVQNNLALSQLRMDAEARLRESEERFRALVESTSEVLYRMSPDWQEMRQLSSSDFLSDTASPRRGWLSAYIHPEDHARVFAAIQEAIRNKSKFELEHRVVQKDGSLGWTLSRAVPILSVDGEIIEWFGAASDITVRKQAEEALLRSEKLASVGRMAATIAHEINNPLEAVTNALFLAQAVDGLPESAHEYLKIADGELKRVAHITRQSLGFYRESNSPRPTSISAVLDSTLELLQNRIRRQGVQIDKQWDGDIEAEAVAGELRQVFSNLLSNSLDAVEKGGLIKLRVSKHCAPSDGQQCVRVTIADNGKGILPELQHHVFEAFFTTKGAVGTGLGLWVSRQIVEKHGGSIRMRSCTEGVRRGTVFSINIPVQASAGTSRKQ